MDYLCVSCGDADKERINRFVNSFQFLSNDQELHEPRDKKQIVSFLLK